MQRIGIPARVNTKVLPSIGFKSTNDRTIISILKALDLIDASGVPTSSWQQMRAKDKAPITLAEKIRTLYGDLFVLLPDANNRPESDIRNFIQGRSKAGERAVSAMVATFKVLCSMADFSATHVAPQPVANNHGNSTPLGQSPIHVSGVGMPVNASVALAPQIAINLQLQLPDGADADYIDSVFESIARHILGRQPQEEVTFIDEEDQSLIDDDDNLDG